MKQAFFIALTGLILLSAIAIAIRPRESLDGKTPIIWVSDDNPARREQIDLFNRMNPKLHLQLDPGQTDSAQKIIVQSLAGVGPDLFCTYDGFGLSTYVKSGIAWDVTDALTKAGIDFKKDVWGVGSPTVVFEDKVYGFPANVAVDAMWFHKDMFEAAGVPFPTGQMSWDEFLPLAKKLTVRDANGRIKQYGVLFDFNGSWPQFLLQWGGSLYSPDGTRCTIDSPEAIAATEFMHDLIYKHRVMPSPVEEAAMATQGGWGSGAITWFGAKKGAMALGGRWWLCNLRNYKGLKLGAFECPHQKLRVFRGYGKGIIINRNSPRREEALNFLTYMARQEYNELVNHQADALGPIKTFTYSDKYLHDPDYPQEDFNAVWRDVMNYGVPDQVSPFVNGQVAVRILTKQLDLIKNNQKSPADALQTAARQINEEIQKTLKIDPVLKKRYEELTRK